MEVESEQDEDTMPNDEIIVNAPDEFDIKIIKWKVREGAPINNAQTVLLYKPLQDDNDASKGNKAVKMLKTPKGGIVHKRLFEEGATVEKGLPVLKICKCTHRTVIKDMCADCGIDLKQLEEEGGTSGELFSLVHTIPELKVKKELAEKLGKADTERLLKERKLVLLVDLDQTLIHTTNDDVPKNIKGIHHFRLSGSSSSPMYHTKLRPHTSEFLNNISQYFELHICTFGARNYAHKIAKILDPDGKFFSQRILSRDECLNISYKTDNLKALFPCGDSMVCIIDDREDVWNAATNLIPVKPYHFFQHTGDINAPPHLSKHDLDGEGVDFRDLSKKSPTLNNDNIDENNLKSDNKEMTSSLENTIEKSNDEIKITSNESQECETKDEEIGSSEKSNDGIKTTSNETQECETKDEDIGSSEKFNDEIKITSNETQECETKDEVIGSSEKSNDGIKTTSNETQECEIKDEEIGSSEKSNDEIKIISNESQECETKDEVIGSSEKSNDEIKIISNESQECETKDEEIGSSEKSNDEIKITSNETQECETKDEEIGSSEDKQELSQNRDDIETINCIDADDNASDIPSKSSSNIESGEAEAVVTIKLFNNGSRIKSFDKEEMEVSSSTEIVGERQAVEEEGEEEEEEVTQNENEDSNCSFDVRDLNYCGTSSDSDDFQMGDNSNIHDSNDVRERQDYGCEIEDDSNHDNNDSREIQDDDRVIGDDSNHDSNDIREIQGNDCEMGDDSNVHKSNDAHEIQHDDSEIGDDSNHDSNDVREIQDDVCEMQCVDSDSETQNDDSKIQHNNDSREIQNKNDNCDNAFEMITIEDSDDEEQSECDENVEKSKSTKHLQQNQNESKQTVTHKTEIDSKGMEVIIIDDDDDDDDDDVSNKEIASQNDTNFSKKDLNNSNSDDDDDNDVDDDDDNDVDDDDDNDVDDDDDNDVDDDDDDVIIITDNCTTSQKVEENDNKQEKLVETMEQDEEEGDNKEDKLGETKEQHQKQNEEENDNKQEELAETENEGQNVNEQNKLTETKEQDQKQNEEENDKQDKLVESEESVEKHDYDQDKLAETKANEEKNDNDQDKLAETKEQDQIQNEKENDEQEKLVETKENDNEQDKLAETKEQDQKQNEEIRQEAESAQNNENQSQEQLQDKCMMKNDNELIEIEDPDDYLLYLESILLKIHHEFYDIYDKTEEIPDLKILIPELRSKVLKGLNLVFSGMVPTHAKLEQSRAYCIATSLGANVEPNLSDITTHLVAATSGTFKYKAARKRKEIFIVNTDWLWCCAERWERADENLFPVDKMRPIKRNPPPHCHSPEHKTKYNECSSTTGFLAPQPSPSIEKAAEPKFIDTINPLLCFSNADVDEMNQDFDQFFQSDSSSSDSQEINIEIPPIKKELLKRKRDEDNENRQRKFFVRDNAGTTVPIPVYDDDDDDDNGNIDMGNEENDSEIDECQDKKDDDDDDEPLSAKFRRGEDLPSDVDLGSSSDDGSVENRVEDDGEWNMMGAALEREFLGLEDN